MKISSVKNLSKKENKEINGGKCNCICRNFAEEHIAPLGILEDKETCYRRCYNRGRIFYSCKEYTYKE